MLRRLQIGHRLEQRRHVEGHVAIAVQQPAPARQQQDREQIVGALGHAHDKRTDGVETVALAACSDRAEHCEGFLRLPIHRARRFRA